jgi:hypothetical protein
MNDLSFMCLLNFSELTSSLPAFVALILGALAFLGYELVAEVVSEGQPAAAGESLTVGYWEDYTLPTNQLSRGVVIPLLQSDTPTEEKQEVEEAKSLQDPSPTPVIVLDEDPYWGVWTEADRLSLTELVSDLEEVPPLGEILDAHPFKGEADNLNQLTLEELLGGAYPAEDEDIEFWDNPEFWARHI